MIVKDIYKLVEKSAKRNKVVSFLNAELRAVKNDCSISSM